MRYATTLVQSVLGLVAAAISLAALPVLATHFSQRDEDRFDQTLVQAVRMVTVLIVPAVFGLAALSRPVVGLLFQHGETGPAEAHSIAVVLLAYLPGTLFAAYDQILIYMFYSRRSTWIPVLVGVFSVGAYFAAAALLANRYGAVGLGDRQQRAVRQSHPRARLDRPETGGQGLGPILRIAGAGICRLCRLRGRCLHQLPRNCRYDRRNRAGRSARFSFRPRWAARSISQCCWPLGCRKST